MTGIEVLQAIKDKKIKDGTELIDDTDEKYIVKSNYLFNEDGSEEVSTSYLIYGDFRITSKKEFEEIEEIDMVDNDTLEWTGSMLGTNFQTLNEIINKLINNQEKIIKKLEG